MDSGLEPELGARSLANYSRYADTSRVRRLLWMVDVNLRSAQGMKELETCSAPRSLKKEERRAPMLFLPSDFASLRTTSETRMLQISTNAVCASTRPFYARLLRLGADLDSRYAPARLTQSAQIPIRLQWLLLTIHVLCSSSESQLSSPTAAGRKTSPQNATNATSFSPSKFPGISTRAFHSVQA